MLTTCLKLRLRLAKLELYKILAAQALVTNKEEDNGEEYRKRCDIICNKKHRFVQICPVQVSVEIIVCQATLDKSVLITSSNLTLMNLRSAETLYS